MDPCKSNPDHCTKSRIHLSTYVDSCVVSSRILSSISDSLDYSNHQSHVPDTYI